MKIKFEKSERLILSCSHDIGRPSTIHWIYELFEKKRPVKINKFFTFSVGNLSDKIPTIGIDANFRSINFTLGHLLGEYYKIDKNILNINYDLYLHKNVSFNDKLFLAPKGVSIFPILNEFNLNDLYIGGFEDKSILLKTFDEICKSIPTNWELRKYVTSRVSNIFRTYIETSYDGEKKYKDYLNKKISKTGTNLTAQFRDVEIIKYQSILNKLNLMLNDENSYNEKQWQKEILEIILLLYPKYLYAFPEAPIRDTYNNKNRNVDFMLIDSSGNADIVEIKQPFDACIITKNQYRDNYIPLKDLSGTVMQVEKYIFYLNKWGKKGEDSLTEKYKSKLPLDFQIKITNPSGLIIMGREIELTKNQIADFEVIKRQYKNVVDIITYDDLLRRLEFIINKFQSI